MGFAMKLWSSSFDEGSSSTFGAFALTGIGVSVVSLKVRTDTSSSFFFGPPPSFVLGFFYAVSKPLVIAGAPALTFFSSACRL